MLPPMQSVAALQGKPDFKAEPSACPIVNILDSPEGTIAVQGIAL